MTRAIVSRRRAGRVRCAAPRPPTPCATSRSTARNIIPSGPVRRRRRRSPQADQPGADVRRAHAAVRQRRRTSDLNRYFKSEQLGTKGQGPLKREPVPRKGVRIIRDRFNVPHIYGKTNDDVTWGAGWALAHDRELLLEQARYNARVAVVDAPGLDGDRPDRRAQDLPAERADRARGAEGGRQAASATASRGRRLLHDIDVFVKGINAYYRKAKARRTSPGRAAT